MTRPQLVLDIGGVLATNLTPLFWQLTANEATVSHEELYRAYKQQISEHLWTGSLSEEQFWLWLSEYAPRMSTVRARSFIEQSLKPLPAMKMLEKWSLAADLHLLSNHLPTWVEPIVKPNTAYWKSVTISSEWGYKKPDIRLYEQVLRHLPAESGVLFVDDQDKNLRPAASLGWRTLLADENGVWIEQVLPLLEQAGRKE